MAENLHLLRNKEERPFYYQPFKSAEIDLRKKKTFNVVGFWNISAKDLCCNLLVRWAGQKVLAAYL